MHMYVQSQCKYISIHTNQYIQACLILSTIVPNI